MPLLIGAKCGVKETAICELEIDESCCSISEVCL